MSVVNTMLRDLEARGSDQRKLRIPVKKPLSDGAGGYRVLVGGTALVVIAVVAWQWGVLPGLPVTTGGGKSQPLLPAANAVAQQAVIAPQAPVEQLVVSALPVAQTVQASWQWSNDGFALQLDGAADLRYGVERVDANTLKISLAHPALETLEIASPTPRWIETLRVQRDEQQQSVTVHAVSRLEYEIAALADNALVLSVWRSKEELPASTVYSIADDSVAAAVAPATALPAAAALPEGGAAETRAPRQRSAVATGSYNAPRIERTALTPAQQDARLTAEAAAEIRAGQTARAITMLRKAQEASVAGSSNVAGPKSTALLVTLLLSQQRQVEAVPYLERALTAAPSDAALLKLKSRMLAAQGDPERARAVLEALQPTNSRDTELLALCASLSQQMHDFAAAATYYLQWTRIEPASGSAWYGLALALDAQASPVNAIAAYRQALNLISDARLRDYANTRIRSLGVVPEKDISNVKNMPLGAHSGTDAAH